jgi:uncharacterized membrane protein
MLKTKRGRNTQRMISTPALIVLLITANIALLFVLWPIPWMQKFYLVASPFCPQRAAHSLFIGGQQMPIEARMFGMFSGALLALIYFAARRQIGAASMPRGWRLGLCVALFGVMAFDGTQALLYDVGLLRLYTPNLYLRLGTGLASGVGIAMVLTPLTNQALWKRPRADQQVFTGWKDVACLAMVQTGLFVFTLAGLPSTLLLLSLMNTIAILTLMTALMTLILVMITRRVGRFSTWREAVAHFSGGFLSAMLFIAALAVARLVMFGRGPLG